MTYDTRQGHPQSHRTTVAGPTIRGPEERIVTVMTTLLETPTSPPPSEYPQRSVAARAVDATKIYG
ncbi:MAG: hypothetical protein ACRDV7_05025, partial [Acidimicrobiia bacterium]